MNVKQFLSYVSVALLVLTLLSGCDDVSQEPKFRDKEVTISAEGGSRTCEIILRKTPWAIERLYVDEMPMVTKGSTLPREGTKSIYRTELTYHMNEKGELTFTYDWITFIFARDKKSVTVVAKPNKTGKYRQVALALEGYMMDTSLDIYQEP